MNSVVTKAAEKWRKIGAIYSAVISVMNGCCFKKNLKHYVPENLMIVLALVSLSPIGASMLDNLSLSACRAASGLGHRFKNFHNKGIAFSAENRKAS